MTLKYFPKNIIVSGKPKVYFSCPPEDFDRLFAHHADLILEACSNAVLFYRDEQNADAEEPIPETLAFEDAAGDMESFEYLDEMQLVVVMVTANTFTNSLVRGEIDYAVKNHIAILPLMQDGLDPQRFEKIEEGLHCLNEFDSDITAVPFKEKLKAFLSSVLISDELAAKIREAFDAYIFVSYRKKDRAYAKKIMHLIHKNDFCRDIASWYDEFLVPGEDFNEAIVKAMQKSQIFTLVVTPNLLEEGNYVQCHEYPDSKKYPLEHLAIEAQETDRKGLEEKFQGITDIIPAEDEEALKEALARLVEKIAIGNKVKDEKHLFFMGLAYLMGIDVDKDVEKGIELIREAAELGLPEAYEKLVELYRYGIGTPRKLNLALDKQSGFVKLIGKSVNENAEVSAIAKYFDECIRMADICMEAYQYERNIPLVMPSGLDKEAQDARSKSYQEFLDNFFACAKYYINLAWNHLDWLKEKDAVKHLEFAAAIQEKVSGVFEAEYQTDRAIKIYESAAKNYSYLIDRLHMDSYKIRLAYCYFKAGSLKYNAYILARPDEKEQMKEGLMDVDSNFEKAFVIYKSLFKTMDLPEIKRGYIKLVQQILSVKFALQVQREEDTKKALSEAYYIAENLYEQTKTGDDAYALAGLYELETRLVSMPKEEKIRKYERYIRLTEEAYHKTGYFFYQLEWKAAEGKLAKMKEE